MSAPTALEEGALLRGIAWWTAPDPQDVRHETAGSAARGTGGRTGAPQGRERRAQDPVSRLGREHDETCRQASDPYEIVAALEAAGLDDRRARAEYGAASTFELAEELWSRVPWRPAADDAHRDVWRLPAWQGLVRGLVYVLPPGLGALALRGITDVPAPAVLLAATAVAICSGQALSVVGHLLAGRAQRRALGELARRAPAAAGLLALAAVLGTLAAGGPALLVGALCGQLAFVVAATVLLVLGRDLRLLALIAPGVLGAGAVLLLDGIPTQGVRPALVAAGAAAVVLPVAGALAAAPRETRGEPLRRAVGPAELSVAGWAAVYGLGLALLASAALLAFTSGATTLPAAHVVAATLPLTATLGVAEYLLHRARSRCVRGMLHVDALQGFARAARGELRGMVLRHAAVTAAVGTAVLLLARPGGGELAGVTGGYAVLGVALLLCTTLLSFGEVVTASLLALGGGVAVMALVLLASRGTTGLATGLPVVVGLLAVAAYVPTRRRFVLTSAHR